jgi:hypothetical protein
MAAIVGLALGLVAASSRSLLPAMAFHLVFNTLGILLPQASPQLLEQIPLLQHALYAVDGGCLYRWQATALGTIVAAGIAAWFWRLSLGPRPLGGFRFKCSQE